MRLLLILSIVCLSFKADDYVKRWQKEAIYQEELNGIPWRISLAQAALESGWGTSRGAVKFNAHFGIRAYSGKGYVNADGLARMYRTPEESWSDYANLMCNEYQECFECEDLDCWAECISNKYIGPRRSQEDKRAYKNQLLKIIKRWK